MGGVFIFGGREVAWLAWLGSNQWGGSDGVDCLKKIGSGDIDYLKKTARGRQAELGHMSWCKQISSPMDELACRPRPKHHLEGVLGGTVVWI
jgi:hypothetical protein